MKLGIKETTRPLTPESILQNLSAGVARCFNDTWLKITAYNSVDISLDVSATLLASQSPDAAPAVFAGSFTPTMNRVASVFTMPLTDGYLNSVRVALGAGAPLVQRGQCFLVAEIQKGNSANPPASQILFADYITQLSPLTFPGSPVVSPTDGTGALLAVFAGFDTANQSIACPANALWKIKTFSTILVTDATATIRVLNVEISSFIGANLDLYPSTMAGASTQVRLMGSSFGTAPSIITIPSGQILETMLIPENYPLTGGNFISFTILTGAGAGDVWSAASTFVLVEEFINI